MLKWLPLRQVGLKGLIRDIQPHDVPASQFTGIVNMRIANGALSALPMTTPALEFAATEEPLFAHPFWIAGGDGVVVVLRDTAAASVEKVYFYNQAAVRTDITPTTALTQSDYWYATQLGEMFILTNGLDDPQSIEVSDLGTNPLGTLPGWDTAYKCTVIENYRSFLVCCGITKSGTYKPNMIKWSHPVASDDAQTWWDITDPSLLTGENEMATAGRELVALQPLRDSLVLAFDQALWRMDFVGGQYVMQFSPVYSDDGVVSAHAMTNMHGTALVVGYRDIYLFDGQRKKSLSDGRLTRWFYQNLVVGHPVKVTYYPARNESWVLFQTATGTEADTALVYNELHDAWTQVDLRGEITQLVNVPNMAQSVESWSSSADGWDGLQATLWSDLTPEVTDTDFVGLSRTNRRLDLMDSPTGSATFFGDRLYAEHTKIDLDESGIPPSKSVRYISRLAPQMTGTGTVRFRFGYSQRPAQAVTWSDAVDYDIENDEYVDVRLAGRYLALRLEGISGVEAQFGFSGLDVEVELEAGR